MKTSLRYLFFIAVLLFAQSCTKSLNGTNQPPIAGSWVLSESSKNSGNGWYYFDTGLEQGVFRFYNSGAAEYDDGYNFMRGNWRIRTISSGYYDQYGNWNNDLHDSFEIHVYDRVTQGSADLNFDDVVFTGNRIIATNYNGYTVARYTFRRY